MKRWVSGFDSEKGLSGAKKPHSGVAFIAALEAPRHPKSLGSGAEAPIQMLVLNAGLKACSTRWACSTRLRILLLKSWQRRRYRVAVEVEGYCAVKIGAVDVDSGGLQAREDFGFGKTERGSESERDHGIAWLHRRQDFWSGGGGAAVVSYL
jgi:hypothetical protein